MSSFFGRLKGSSGASNSGASASTSKKDANASNSPLETLLADAGPLRSDGSDKFFGILNPSNTCYCNSVVQCLYYSEPFREKVISFPNSPSADRPRGLGIELSPNPTGVTGNNTSNVAPTSPPTKQPDTPPVPRRFTTAPTSPNMTGTRSDETHKDTFDYMKKMAIQNGPFMEITYDNSQTYGMQTSLFTGLKDIFEAIVAQRSRIGVFALNKFLQTLRENFDTFRTPLHQDAHEFLNILLNDVVTRVSDYSKKPDGSSEPAGGSDPSSKSADISPSTSAPEMTNGASSTSWVHELFEGTLTSETRCLTCETTSQRDEAFIDLSVDLDEHSSVTSCLKKFSEEEMLCERNKFHCDQCSGLQEAEKRMKIKRLPRILALHLKRFKYTEELGRLQKLFHKVVFPFHLRLFNTTDDAVDPDRLYELYAIIVHLGSTPFHGHYVSIIKTPDYGWLLFDDELVLPVDKNYVRNFFGGDPRNPACAYVLFYQETTEEAVKREQQAERPADASAPVSEAFETSTLGRKANGNLLPSADQLGIVHDPPVEDLNAMVSLNHTLSEPSPPIGNSNPLPALEQVMSSPGIMAPNSEELQVGSKKELVNEEKDKTHAEKDAEKSLRDGENNHVKTGSFSRFRPLSRSMRQKQKQRISSAQEIPGNSDGTESSALVPPTTPEKSKSSRFSIGKKKSPFLS